jgi:hypothetical protein
MIYFYILPTEPWKVMNILASFRLYIPLKLDFGEQTLEEYVRVYFLKKNRKMINASKKYDQGSRQKKKSNRKFISFKLKTR